MITPSSTVDRPADSVAHWWKPLAAIALGALLVYVAGFAQARLVHDSAHDARHAAALPCH